MPDRPMLALLNPHSGSATHARDVLQADPRFAVREVEPDMIADVVRAEIERGTPRILVSGGDGTISAVVGAAARSQLEVAVLPGGTLNHFARDMGVPLDDPVAALNLACHGSALPTDLGYLNGRAILNTSSVGAYVDFVRHREESERHFGYRLASVIAAARVGLRPKLVSLEIRTDDGITRRYETPLLFVAVGEREFDRKALGGRRIGGASALHVVVAKGRARPRVVLNALRAVIHGKDREHGEDGIDVQLLDHLVATMKVSVATVAADGELVRMKTPLRYSMERGAVLVVRPLTDGKFAK